jgi:autotransporter-associated beta strand protein
VLDNGTFDISATTCGASITTLSGSGQVNLGAQTLTLTAAQDTFAGVIGGTGGLTVAGGSETLTGTNIFTGATAIDSGASLLLAGTGSIATSSGVVDNGTFDISQTTNGALITTLSGSGQVNMGGATLALTAAQDTFAGSIGGSGNVMVVGGTETLTGTNTYTGVTVINSGATLALAGTGSIATSLGVMDNGTFDISATTAGASIASLAGAGSVNLGGQTLTLTAASDIFAGVIGGTGGLTTAGGSEILTGTNTYTGATTINSGATLLLAGTGAIATSSGVVDNGTFDISLTTGGASIASLSGSGQVNLGSETLTLTAAQGTFSGVITDPPGGSLVIAGGTETLTGANTYSGSTIINAGAGLSLAGTGSIATSTEVADNGTFDISGATAGASITTLSGSGSVNLGAQTLTLTAAQDIFAGVIGGTGGLAITGGVESLTGANTYSGGTSIANASLMINGDKALGATTGGVAINNGTLIASSDWTSARAIAITGMADIAAMGSSKVTLSGVISGSGTLVADGGGSIVLNGTNTYTGGTVIVNKTAVFVGNDAALGAASAPVSIENGSLNVTANLATSRDILISQSGQLNTDGFQLTSTGQIDDVAANGSLIPVLVGDATVTGSLQFQTASGFVVTAGSLLRGVGTYNTPIAVDGTLAPGNSPGTLTDNSTVTIAPHGTLNIDIDGTGTGTGAGNYSRVIVTGAGNTFVAGGTLTPQLRGITGDATNTFTPRLTQNFTIVAAAGGVTGQFQNLVEPTGLAAGTRFDALYSPTAITLWVTPSTYANLSAFGVHLDANQAAVGAGLDALRPTPGQRASTATTAVLQTLYGEQASQLPHQLDELNGAIYGEGLRYGLVKAEQTRDTVDQVSEDALLTRATQSQAQLGQGRVWLVASGSQTNLGSADTQFSGGLTGGVDRWWTPDLMAGIGGSWASGQISENINGDQLQTNTYQLFAYGALVEGANVLSAQVGGNDNSGKATRAVGLNGLVAEGQGDGFGYDLSAQVEHRFDVGAWTLAPLARLSADSVHRGALSETGASSVGLDVDGATATSVRSLLGVGASTAWTSGETRFTFTGKLGWGHEFADDSFATVQAFEGAPATAFSTRTATFGRDGAVVSLSPAINLKDGFSLFLKYEGDLRSNQSSQSGSVGMSYRW